MLQPTPLIIQAAQLPATFTGTPNDLFQAMVARMRIVSPSGNNFFVVGDIEPSFNAGPWLKGGTQWWVWDSNLKKYVPLDISESETKWFWYQNSTPPTSDPPVWLKVTDDPTEASPSGGAPIGWFAFDGTVWQPVSNIVAKSVTLDGMADGPQGSLIIYDDTNRPNLLPLGDASKFLAVKSDGSGVEWRDLIPSDIPAAAHGIPKFISPVTIFNDAAAADWTTYDASGSVPAGASAVIMQVIGGNNTDAPPVSVVYFRKNSLGDQYIGLYQGGNNVNGSQQGIFPVDEVGAVRSFQYKSTGFGTGTCTIYLVGYVS